MRCLPLVLSPRPSRSQEFVNHGGILFKLYVLGDKVMVFRRQSLPDIPPPGDAAGEGEQVGPWRD